MDKHNSYEIYMENGKTLIIEATDMYEDEDFLAFEYNNTACGKIKNDKIIGWSIRNITSVG